MRMKLAGLAIAAGVLVGAQAGAATFQITTTSTTAGFWVIDCAAYGNVGECTGQGGATIQVPFLSVAPSPTTGTGTIDIDLATGNITGGGYAIDGTGDITATIGIGVLFFAPNNVASAVLTINDNTHAWLATSAVGVVGEDFLYNPGQFTDPSASLVTCAGPPAVCSSATVLAIIADGGLAIAHAPNPLAAALLNFTDGTQTNGTLALSSDVFTPNTTPLVIPPSILGTRTVGTTTVTLTRVVPEPGTLLLLSGGMLGLGLIGRRRN